MNIKSKSFEVTIDDKKVSMYFARPNVSASFDIDLEYRKSYADAIRNGVMTEVEAKKAFKKSGSWTKEDDDKIQKISTQIALLTQEIEKPDFSQHEANMKKVKKIAEARADLIRINSDKMSLFDNTAEAISNLQKIHKMIELCLMDSSTNEKYFNDREHYERFSVNKKDALSEIFRHAIYFEYGTDEDIMKNWAELNYLNDYAEHLNKEKAKEEAIKEKEKVVVDSK